MYIWTSFFIWNTDDFYCIYRLPRQQAGKEDTVQDEQGKYIVLTNNPLVFDKLEKTHEVIYLETTYEGLLREVRDRIHDGHLLLTHPLSGSVKPNETPYKSVLISAGKEEVDRRSLTIIENAIDACHKFQDKTGRYGESVLEDFQLIDWTLLESGLASADAW